MSPAQPQPRPQPTQPGANPADESAEGLAYRRVDSPLGVLTVIAGPQGVTRLELPGQQRAAPLPACAPTAPSGGLVDGSTGPGREFAEQAAYELSLYFAGKLREFAVLIDAPEASPFAADVRRAMAAIPYGETLSYAGLASASGHPGAARAAGSVCASNPVPILVPCHRVVRADGSPGSYRGGTAAKELLLRLEATNA